MDKTINLNWCIIKALQEEIGMNAKEKFEKIVIGIEDFAQNDLIKASDISKQIAFNMLMGYRELNDVFKFFTDRSLNEYIKERKMMAAYTRILVQDEMDIEQAIEISGLDNQSSFSKKFKEVFDMTPQEAFIKKDQSKLLQPLSWESVSSNGRIISEPSSNTPDSVNYYGVTLEQYNKIIQAQEYQALYDLNDAQSLTAFQISEAENVPLEDAYSFVEDYLNYMKCISSKYDECKELEFLLSLASKNIKKIYFTVTKSVSEAMDIIDTAKDNSYSLTKKHIEYLAVYCKDPYCYFNEFLRQVEKFEELNGKDFEEYWDLIYSWGFSPEDAVKGIDYSMDECVLIEEPDYKFDEWAYELTDYANQEKIDIEYDEDNPYY